jgi:acetylglutamate kinase
VENAIIKAAALVEALEYIQQFHDKIVVVKMGGSLMDDQKAIESVLTDIVFMATVGIRPIVVHGGGKEITAALQSAGLETRFVQGRRYTDQRTLSIAEHVLCNTINRRLVETLNQRGAQAVGMHSLASGVLTGERMFLQGDEGRRIDIGYVGKVTKVNSYLLKVLCQSETIPVIAPIATDQGGGKLNINADEAAGEVAAAVQAEKLVVLSDTHGIRLDPNDPNSLASELNKKQIEELVAQGVISGGMMPKVDACLRAMAGGVKKTHIIDGRIAHSLLLEIYTDKGVGTQIMKVEK